MLAMHSAYKLIIRKLQSFHKFSDYSFSSVYFIDETVISINFSHLLFPAKKKKKKKKKSVIADLIRKFVPNSFSVSVTSRSIMTSQPVTSSGCQMVYYDIIWPILSHSACIWAKRRIICPTEPHKTTSDSTINIYKSLI